MKNFSFSQYVAVREQERNFTIQALLSEIEELEKQLAIVSAAFNKLSKEKKKHHVAGFKTEEKK